MEYARKEPMIREVMKSKKSKKGSIKGSGFRLEPFTISKHYSAIRSADGRTIGVIEDEKMFLIGDRVELRADSDGYIAPSILEEGMGVITKIRINGTVRFGIQMDNGEFGYATTRHIWKKYSSE